MQGERSSVFKSIILNPLVLIGLILTGFTLAYSEERAAFQVFYSVETYRNLIIGATLYVLLFDRQYTAGMRRLDIGQTLLAILEAIAIILLVWVGSLFAVITYHIGGENYRDVLRARYVKEGWIKEEKAPKSVEKALQGIDLKAGVKYKITPNDDGSVTVEIEED